MRLQRIDFSNELPDIITVSATDDEGEFISAHDSTLGSRGDGDRLVFSLADAVALTVWVGSLSQVTSPNHEISSEIYECLTSSVFNPYWDGGVREAQRDLA